MIKILSYIEMIFYISIYSIYIKYIVDIRYFFFLIFYRSFTQMLFKLMWSLNKIIFVFQVNNVFLICEILIVSNGFQVNCFVCC